MARRLVSLEALIIDEVRHIDGDGRVTQDQEEQIGGSGIYAMVGARMFLLPSRLGMIVSYTDETLPRAMREQLESFGPEMWHFKSREDGGGTCRGVQTYQAGARTETLIDYLLFDPIDLLDTPFGDPLPSTLHAVSFLDRTERILQQIEQIAAKREGGWSPSLIWEPYYAESTHLNWSSFARIVPHVDVFSPNHVEALRLASVTAPSETELRASVEQACSKLAALGARTATVVRAGSLVACYTLSSDPGKTRWIPAYWSADQSKVVDPTGAGNGFMGGLAAAIDEGHDFEEAVLWGTIAASFIVEQAGLPVHASGSWNGGSVDERLEELRQRIRRTEDDA